MLSVVTIITKHACTHLLPSPQPRGAVDNQYAYNFLPMDTMAKMKAGGPRRATRIFAHPTAPR